MEYWYFLVEGNEMLVLSQKLPFVYIYNDKVLETFNNIIATDINAFVNEIFNIIKHNDVKIMVINIQPVSL